MPARHAVDPQFDGHAERPWRELSPEEKLDWLWGCMQLLNIGASRRRPPGASAHVQDDGEPAPSTRRD